jgi:predicted GIY-YIG superfamily endonuclease
VSEWAAVEFFNETPTALYRFYAADGTLLYVGITDTLKRRVSQHAVDKKWWPDVARKTVEWHPSREAAVIAELAAIKAEKPRHNTQGTSESPARPARQRRERAVTQVPRAESADDDYFYYPDQAPDYWEPDHWARVWWGAERSSNCGPYDFLDAFGCPVLAATRAFGQWHEERRAHRDGGGYPVVWCQRDFAQPGDPSERFGYSYSVHADITCLDDWDTFGPAVEQTQARFLKALADAGYCRLVSTGRVAAAFGFEDEIAARVAGAILNELMWGGTDIAARTVEALAAELVNRAAHHAPAHRSDHAATTAAASAGTP